MKETVKYVFYTGARTPFALQLRTAKHLLPEIAMFQSYGQTEAMSIATLPPFDHFLSPDDKQKLLMTSVGRILRPNDIRIVDDNGEVCAPGTEGEVEVRFDPKYTVLGYYRAAELTGDLIHDGWLRTGDKGIHVFAISISITVLLSTPIPILAVLFV